MVYVQNGSGFEEREVTAGDESSNYVIITAGLNEGDKVALRDPTILTVEELAAETASIEEEN